MVRNIVVVSSLPPSKMMYNVIMDASNNNPFSLPTTHGRYGLPAYIHTEKGRAYLVLAVDLYGRWNAGYTYWLEPEDGNNFCGAGHYAILQPTINNAESPDDAMQALAVAKAVYDARA